MRPPRGYARIQFTEAGGRGAAKLTVPTFIARLVGRDVLFKVELTDEGILYRRVEDGALPNAAGLPPWLRD